MLGQLNSYVTKVTVFLIPVALVVGMAGFDGVGGALFYVPSQNDPPQNLEIRTWYDLDAIRSNMAGNHTLMNDLDFTSPGYEELASLIANQGKGWQPIGLVDRICWDSPCGGGGCDTEWYGLNGTFHGQGYEIRDLFINRPNENDVGLFGVVNEGGVIKDIGAVNVIVVGDYYVGGLVGRNRGTVSNSYSSGNVDGYQGVGGLVGINDQGTVSNSYSTGSVSDGRYVGGLAGINYGGTVSNSYSTGDVTGKGDVGGLVGINDQGTVSNSYYNYDEVLINGDSVITFGALYSEDFEQWLVNDKFLDVNERLPQEDGYHVVKNVTDFKELLASGQDDSLKFRLANDLDLGEEPNFYIPYLAGEFDGNGHKILNLSFNFDFVSNVGLFGYLASGGKVTQVGLENANITGDGNIGGLVGESHGTVSDSYSSVSVTGATDVGGLVGLNGGTVSDSYSAGSVTGDWYVGGLVGINDRGTVSNSCSTGSVIGDWLVGGLLGVNNGGTVSNCYCAGSVTGDEDVGGLLGINDRGGTVSKSFWDVQTSRQTRSAGGTGKTTAKMKNIATFSGAGWNIVGVANADARNPSYIWNMVDGETYPFLSWQS
jgi:hypothetical protein